MRAEPLESSDAFHLTAAKGWLELGNHIEANNELEEIEPLNRAHPDVLEVRWQIYRRAGRFDACHEIAEALKAKEPHLHRGTFYLAESLYHVGKIQEAYAELAPSLERFPEAWAVHYDMACYSCLLGRLDEARAYLEKAFTLDGSNTAKLRALDDPDLAAIWSEPKF